MRLNELTSEKWEFIRDRVEPQKQGVYIYYKGVPYPCRAYFNPLNDPNHNLRALNALGMVKKFFLSLFYAPVIPRTFNLKKWERFLESSLLMCQWHLFEFLAEDNEWSVPVWEIGKMVRVFLETLGFNSDIAYLAARIVMCIFEYDQAYRYRLQDLLRESSKRLMQNPRKEIKRLFQLLIDRDIMDEGKQWNIYGRAEKFIKPLLLVLLIPKFKNAFLKAIDGLDFENIKLDINDRYHVSFWRGYDFFGQDFDTRYQFFLDTHKKEFPPYRKREDPNLTANFMLGI